jgi:outer membrane protein assembly complex protein YaeT
LYARIRRPVFNADPTEMKVDILLEIQSGPQTRVRSVKLGEGLSFPETELRQELQLAAGSEFRPSILAEDNNRLLNYYREKGFQDVNINVDVNPYSDTEVELVFSIEEGIRHIIGSVEISGNHKTPDTFIRRELEMSEGDPVNMEKLVMSQKKLYDLDIFRTVNIQRDREMGADGREVIKVEIRETPSLAVRYGFRYNSEEKLEGFGQLDLVNLFGRGRNALFFYRQNKLYKDFRFSLKDPYLFGKRFNTLHSFYYQEMVASVFRSDELGYSVQQEHKLPWELSLSYLYRYSRIHTYELEPSGPFPFDFIYNLSELQTYVVRDTRSDRLNAGRGSFLSLSLTLSPEFLRSEQPYISFFGQFSFFRPLSHGFLWASNYRVGLADAYDEILIPARRFFAGGANSIRGFERDMVGPIDPWMQAPIGGEALFVMNQELRFPVYKWLSGVAFYDMGNTFDNLGDFNPLEARHGIGLGLRLNTPAALIRLDYGFNLFPQLNEPRRVLYFSIGQAF